jgi:serralysin
MAVIPVSNQAALQNALDNAQPSDRIIVEESFPLDDLINSFNVRINNLIVQSNLSSENPLRLVLDANVNQLQIDGPGHFDVTGNATGNVVEPLSSFAGRVTASGEDGNDMLSGGSGNDRLDMSIVNEGVASEDFPHLRGSSGSDRLTGGAGNDAYGVDSDLDAVAEIPGEGRDTVYTSLTDYALPANVEDLVFRNGDLNDTVEAGVALAPVRGTGNDLDNVIIGGADSDTLIGGLGNDTLVGNFRPSSASDRLEGGLGDDQYEVDLLGDIVVEHANEGIDVIRLTIGQNSAGEPLFGRYSLKDLGLDHIENLSLSGRFFDPNVGIPLYNSFTLEGNSLDNEIVGGDEADVLLGLTGNDSLIGGAGNDMLEGGAGDDYYEVDGIGDRVQESGDGGRDTIATFAELPYTLPDNVENLTATRRFNVLRSRYDDDFPRTFTGNSLDNEIVGGEMNDRLAGGAGNDFLVGGKGDDRLAGEAGDDDYDIDSVSDVVVENNGDGHDTISTSLVAYSLAGTAQSPDLVYVEDLIFKGFMIVTDPGNLDQEVSGEEASRAPTVVFDRTVGFSGSGNGQHNVIVGADGNDYLSGLAGDDTLIGLIGQDTLDGGDGRDELYGLSGDDILLGGAAADIVDGGEGNDRLFGGLANDKLWGNTGSDRLLGESGNDQLVGDKGNDYLSGGTGNDRLFGEANADTLDGGNGKDRLLGGDGKDVLRGGSGNDILYGGLGADALRGGAGKDNFVFNTKNGRANVDRIVDFNVTDDTIKLEDFYFSNIGARGRLTTDAFRMGSSAHDASDRVIYDSASGALFYDADGIGGAAQFRFAVLKPGLNVTNNDFVII